MGNGVKYRGDKPRGFTVLTARPKTGRAVAGEFNSPRPSHGGSAGIYTRTLGASVRAGGSTPPDNTRRTTPKTWVLRGVAFPRNCQQLRWIKVFNPRRNCTYQCGWERKIASAIHPRGQAPRHSRCVSVDSAASVSRCRLRRQDTDSTWLNLPRRDWPVCTLRSANRPRSATWDWTRTPSRPRPTRWSEPRRKR